MAQKTKSGTGARTARTGTPREGLTRRGFLGAGAVAGAGVSVEARAARKPRAVGPTKSRITLNVNGKDRALTIEPRVTLLRALRNHLALTGTKEICDGGACGGCNVLVDGVLVNACMTLALDAVGTKVQTIEGLASGDDLHPLQRAFVQHDALQCGFCTPGMVMACKALLDQKKDPTLVDIKRGLSGNLCRCGTYPRVFAAVLDVAKQG